MNSAVETRTTGFPARRLALPLLLFGALFLPSITSVRSYDYFWHLATGRWIVDNGTLLRSDPFAVASDPEPWINGEWLFQLGLYGAFRAVGHSGISILRGLVVAALFVLVFELARRRTLPVAAFLLTIVAWYGADHRLTPRPETVATFFVVLGLWLALLPLSWKRVAAHLMITAIWMQVHPSALLSPVLAAVGGLGEFRDRKSLGKRVAMSAGSVVVLFLNPYGIEGIAAPLRLMRTIGERKFVNLEWLPSSPVSFPLLYLVLLLGGALFVASRFRMREVASFALFLLLGVLAVRHVRNQGFFLSASPILLAPFVPAELALRGRRYLLAGAALIGVVMFTTRLPVATGVDERLFPVRAVERLAAMRLAGNIYNPDQFGGFLIWTFYPARRVLTDGRNELYDHYLSEYDRARLSNVEWRRLLEKYRVTIAVDEYRKRPIEVLDLRSGSRRLVPASLVYFPRDRWALVAFDDVAMVFVRRDTLSPGKLREMELPGEVPDG